MEKERFSEEPVTGEQVMMIAVAPRSGTARAGFSPSPGLWASTCPFPSTPPPLSAA